MLCTLSFQFDGAFLKRCRSPLQALGCCKLLPVFAHTHARALAHAQAHTRSQPLTRPLTSPHASTHTKRPHTRSLAQASTHKHAGGPTGPANNLWARRAGDGPAQQTTGWPAGPANRASLPAIWAATCHHAAPINEQGRRLCPLYR